MGVTVREDADARQGGFALIDCGRKIDSPVRLSFRRLDAEPRNLGPTGWQADAFWFSPDRVYNDGPATVVRVGPEVVDEVSELVPIEISLEGHGVIGIVHWPFITRSVRGPSFARIRPGPRLPSATTSISPSAGPERGVEALTGLTMQQREPIADSASVTPVVKPASKPNPSFGSRYLVYAASAAAIALTLLVGTFLFLSNGSSPSTQPNSETVAAKLQPPPKPQLHIRPAAETSFSGPVGGPIEPATRTLRLSANASGANWRVTKLPYWLTLNVREGRLDAGGTMDLIVTQQPIAGVLRPGTRLDEIVFSVDGGDEVIQTFTLVVRPRTPTSADVSASRGDYRDPLRFVIDQYENLVPRADTFKLTSNATQVRWRVTESPNWLLVEPREGTLEKNSATELFVGVSAAAEEMPPGNYLSAIRITAVDGNELFVWARLSKSEPLPQPTKPSTALRAPPVLTIETSKGSSGRDAVALPIRSDSAGTHWKFVGYPDWLEIVGRTSGYLAPNSQEIIHLRLGSQIQYFAAGEYTSEIRVFVEQGTQTVVPVKLIIR